MSADTAAHHDVVIGGRRNDELQRRGVNGRFGAVIADDDVGWISALSKYAVPALLILVRVRFGEEVVRW